MEEYAITAPGSFSRLAPLVGTFHALHDASEKGLIPPPGFISTSSSSGIAASVAIQRSEEKFVEIEKLLINLRKSQFASFNPEIRNRGILTIAATLGLLLPTHAIKNPYLRTAARIGVSSFAFWAQREFIRDLFQAESFFRYDKLINLLLDKLDFEAIFSSPIKIEIPAVNLNKSGWTLDEILSNPPLYLDGWHNKGWVSVTNFRPEDINLSKDIRNRRFVEGIVNGTRLPYFNPGRTSDGDYVVDTAFLSNVPIHFALSQGYSKIVIPYYNSSVEATTDAQFDNWLKSLNRSLDINVSENTRKAMLGYLRVNNDLGHLTKQKECLKRLEEILDHKSLDEETKMETWRYIQEMRMLLNSLSYSNKKQIEFLFINSRPLPRIHFSEFTKDNITEGINIGWESGWEAVPKIARMIKS